MGCRAFVDDFKYSFRAHGIEQLLHRRGGIHEAHNAISTAGECIQRDQRAQAGAVHKFRPGQIHFNGGVSVQGGANVVPEPFLIGGGELWKSSN
jgi:hypothetical protein